VPLIFDEIQCGMGRTGTFLFSEQLEVTADYYALSKSLGGGLSKIAALLVNTELYEEEFSMIHSSTFAEDDHSASIAIKALDMLERNKGELYKKCTERGEQLLDGLHSIRAKYPSVIKAIRGKGLMLGIEFHKQDDTDSRTFKMLSTQHLLGYVIAGYLLHEHRIRVAPTLSSTATIRLEPSAFISENDCDTLLKALERMCEIMHKKNTYEFLKFMVGAERYNAYATIKNYRIEQRNGNVSGENTSAIRKVAFLGHFIEAAHMKLWDNGFSDFSTAQLEELAEKLYELVDPVLSDESIITSATGDQVSLSFIGLIFTSNIITRHLKKADLSVLLSKIDLALELAKSLNCKVVGFGGYSSIITGNCKDVITDSLALTTGNSLTVAMGIEAMYTAVEKADIDMETSCFAAIGAAGNIASIYSEMIAKSIPRVILIGNSERAAKTIKVAETIYQSALVEILECNIADKACLKGVAKAILNTKTIQQILGQSESLAINNPTLYERFQLELGEKAPVIVTSDYTYLKEANLILGASNAPYPVIFADMLGQHKVVICDIAVPGDVDESVTEKCKNVFLIKGGLVKLPLNPDFTIGGVPLNKGEAFACMSETVLMGLSGINEDYSIGSIHKNQVNRIMQIAKIHGFQLGRMKTGASF
jgi:predicted amino acid dehydrogenase